MKANEMAESAKKKPVAKWHLPFFQGILPFDKSRLTPDIMAGFTLAALAIPGTMGYTKIIGTPVITGLYTILIPMGLFAIFGSSRHLSVGADSATATVVAAGLTGMAAPSTSPERPAKGISRLGCCSTRWGLL